MSFINQALAAGLDDAVSKLKSTGTNASLGGGDPNSTSIAGLVGNIVNIFLGLLGVIFVLLLIYGGYTWATAQGDSKKVETAKSTIINSVIGIIICLSAYIVSSFVVSRLLTATGA